MADYNIIFACFGIILSIGILLLLISYTATLKYHDAEKLSPYECGFDPFQDTRNTFDVQFYLVAILFIVFDLEVVYLFPWAIILGSLNLYGFFVMYVFLFILTIGFFYELEKNALEWA
jgi:NADH:ubiquinone oxidoreductase subunit 3 (subunit A)